MSSTCATTTPTRVSASWPATWMDGYRGRTILAIGAHPDDVEISAGGTLARLGRSGARVIMAAVAIPNLLEERRAEARAAAEILGAERELLEVERCLRVEDLPNHELVRRIDWLIRTYSPDVLLTHSDQEHHYDHVLVHRAAMASLRLRPMDVYFFQPSSCKVRLTQFQPRVWVDITETIDVKLAAIAAHSSQFQGRGLCIETFRDMARAGGLPLGLPYAEPMDLFCLRG